MDVRVLGIVDLNSPHAMGDDNLEHLSAMVQRLHDVAPTMRSTLIMMPVLPQSSSPLGLIDDYKTVQQKLMEHLQHVDTRVVLPFELHPRAAPYSTMREWVEGRFAVDHSTKHNNTWIIMSELAIAGRPKGVMPQLPLQKDLLRVESLDPDKNVTTAVGRQQGERPGGGRGLHGGSWLLLQGRPHAPDHAREDQISVLHGGGTRLGQHLSNELARPVTPYHRQSYPAGPGPCHHTSILFCFYLA